MAEKGGLLEQSLRNDYNTAGSLEVYNHEKDVWYRVTTKDFRSWNGPRRITEPTETKLGEVEVEMITYEYYGPVYKWGTNTVVGYSDTGSLEKSEIWEKARKISNDRK